MKNKNKVEVIVLATDKAGVLSSLMMKGNALGLVYRRNKTEELSGNKQRITISFYGTLNCEKEECIKVLEEHPGVLKIERIAITNTTNES